MAIVGMVVVLYVFTLVDTSNTLEQAQQREVQMLKEEQEAIQDLFSQTAIALVSAIDAKDRYTQGHSVRVAEYSRKIAEISGKNEKECDEIYYAALLHDVGKIGIPDYIINKNRKLTPEEYGVIQSHPVIGWQILSKINKYSYLSTAARYHHERFDGAPFRLWASDEQENALKPQGAISAVCHRQRVHHPEESCKQGREGDGTGCADPWLRRCICLLSPWRGSALINASFSFAGVNPTIDSAPENEYNKNSVLPVSYGRWFPSVLKE